MLGVRRLVDRNGRTTNWHYDLRDRLIRETWAGVGGVIDYTYDSADRLTGVNDTRPNGPNFTFTYDTRGQLQNELQFHPLMNRSVAFDRDYDAVVNQTRLAANIGGALASGGTPRPTKRSPFRSGLALIGKHCTVPTLVTSADSSASIENT